MGRRSSVVLVIGFGVLILLSTALGVGAMRRAGSIYDEMQVAQDTYLQREAFRRTISTDLYLADILIRDYLLDPSPDSTPGRRQELIALRDSLLMRLDVFEASLLDNATPNLRILQGEAQEYLESLDPVFEWTPEQKAQRTWIFLARKVLPQRETVVKLVQEMARLNTETLGRERERIASSQAILHGFLLRMTAFVIGLGTIVAVVTIHRVLSLERRHERQRKQIEESETNLRRLSNRMVETQEGERRNLSRELHDEVGQTMTALGIELGNLEDVYGVDPQEFRDRMKDVKRLNGDAIRAVRDLAMGLRPSMLDDLGLEAALHWQGREFSRHTGVPAEVKVNGVLDDLNDAQRTCIYRVVQEALTNCARHARANRVLVSVSATDEGVAVSVRDNGIGFNSTSSTRGGLGLLGIQERVQALGGKVSISSKEMNGTTLEVSLPIGVAA